jgi:hypothetical protein
MSGQEVAMSMWVHLVRISAEGFARITQDKALLSGFMRDDEAVLKELGVDPEDETRSAGFDHGCLGQDHEEWLREARQDAIDRGLDPDELVESENPFTRKPMSVRRYQRFQGRKPELYRDLGCGGKLDYVATYGPAYFIEPASVAKLVARQPHLADDEDAQAMIERAIANAEYVICAIT